MGQSANKSSSLFMGPRQVTGLLMVLSTLCEVPLISTMLMAPLVSIRNGVFLIYTMGGSSGLHWWHVSLSLYSASGSSDLQHECSSSSRHLCVQFCSVSSKSSSGQRCTCAETAGMHIYRVANTEAHQSPHAANLISDTNLKICEAW